MSLFTERTKEFSTYFDGKTPGGSGIVTKDPAGSGAGRTPDGGRPHGRKRRQETQKIIHQQTTIAPPSLKDKPVKRWWDKD